MARFAEPLSTLGEWETQPKRYSRYFPVFGTVTRGRYMDLRGGIYSERTSGQDA